MIKILIISIILGYGFYKLLEKIFDNKIDITKEEVRCSYNEQPKCYGQACVTCEKRKECDHLCGSDCSKCEGLTKIKFKYWE